MGRKRRKERTGAKKGVRRTEKKEQRDKWGEKRRKIVSETKKKRDGKRRANP